MEKLERDGEDGRQILASHQKLHPDAISYIAPRILVTSRLFGFCCWVIWVFLGGTFPGGQYSTSSFSPLCTLRENQCSENWTPSIICFSPSLFFPSVPLWPPWTRIRSETNLPKTLSIPYSPNSKKDCEGIDQRSWFLWNNFATLQGFFWFSDF